MKIKKVLPIVGLVALTALGTIGYIKRDNLMYKAYKKSDDVNRKLYNYPIIKSKRKTLPHFIDKGLNN